MQQMLLAQALPARRPQANQAAASSQAAPAIGMQPCHSLITLQAHHSDQPGARQAALSMQPAAANSTQTGRLCRSESESEQTLPK